MARTWVVISASLDLTFAPNSTVKFACIPDKPSPKLRPLSSLQRVLLMRLLERDHRSEFSVTKDFGNDEQLRGVWRDTMDLDPSSNLLEMEAFCRSVSMYVKQADL
jgi:hypothetical protein